MRSNQCIGTLIFVFILFSSLAFAGESALMFRDGSTLVGEVVKCDNNTVTFKYSASGEEKTTVVQAKDLDPYSFYRVRSEHIGRDAGANLELAKYCLENGMFARSITHYRQAKALDASLVESFDRNERDRGGIAHHKRGR